MDSAIKGNWNLTVTICRVLGMFMIIICHIGTSIGNSTIGEVFQVGVQLFLFISGYVYGSKEIKNRKNWLWNRFIKISIPCYLFLIFIITLSFIRKTDINVCFVLMYLFDIQGYQHIFCFLPPVNSLMGTAHLWFITIIMLCYFIVFLLNSRNNFVNYNKEVFLSIGFLLTVLFGFFCIRVDYFWIFFLGYVLSCNSWSLSKKGYMISSFLMFFAVVLRLVTKGYCDITGDNTFYLYVVIPITYNLMALWIFETIEMFNKIIDLKKVCTYYIINKVLFLIDHLSYYIYITHYIFIDKPLVILGMVQPLILNILIGVLILGFSGFLLQKLSEPVIKRMVVRERNEYENAVR